MPAQASVVLDLVDRISAKLRRVGERWLNLDRSLKGMRGAQELAGRLELAAAGAENLGGKLRGGLAAPVAAASNLEEVLTRVGAKSQASAEELAALKASAREFGKDSRLRFSATQVAEGFDVMATAGVKPADQLKLIESNLLLASAGFTSVAEAATLSSDVMGAWSIPADQAGAVANQLAGATNTSKQSIDTLQESLKAVAPVAAKAGASLSDVLAVQAALAAEGVRGSEAGTVSRAVFLRLQAPEKVAAAKLKALKVATKDAQGNLRSLDAIMVDLSAAMDRKWGAGKGGAKRARFLKELFGEEGVAGAQILMKAATGGAIEEFRKGIEGFDAAAAAAASNSNTAGAVATFKSSLEELAITVGDVLLPPLSELLQRSTELAGRMSTWAAENPVLVKSLVAVAAGITGVATVVAPLLRLVGLAAQGFAAFRVAAAGLKVAMLASAGAVKAVTAALIANPIGLIVAGVVALVVAGVALWKNWDRVSAFFRRIWERLPGPVQSALRLITAPVRLVIALGRKLWEGAVILGQKFAGVWDKIPRPVKIAGAIIAGPIGWLIGAAALIAENWETLGATFSRIWDGIAAGVGKGIDWIAEKLAWVGGQIEDFERSLPEWVTGRERVVAGGAAAMARTALAAGASGPAMGGQSEALAAARAYFGGELRITIDDRGGNVAATSSKSSGNAGIKLATGVQT